MDKQEHQTIQPPVDAGRRRLTQGALAAPVVLATLASKNALAAAPYNCTISGMLSGNTSSHGNPLPCNTLGVSPGYWKNHSNWPSPYLTTSHFATYFTIPSSSGWNSNTTLLAVLQSGGGGDVAFARAAVGSLLNAQNYAPNYPLTPAQVRQLFNATVNNGSLVLSTVFPNIIGTTTWHASDVKTYFESLYS